MESVLPKYRLGSKYLILEILFRSFYKKKGFTYLYQACKNFRHLLIENIKAALFMSEDALNHI